MLLNLAKLEPWTKSYQKVYAVVILVLGSSVIVSASESGYYIWDFPS